MFGTHFEILPFNTPIPLVSIRPVAEPPAAQGVNPLRIPTLSLRDRLNDAQSAVKKNALRAKSWRERTSATSGDETNETNEKSRLNERTTTKLKGSRSVRYATKGVPPFGIPPPLD